MTTIEKDQPRCTRCTFALERQDQIMRGLGNDCLDHVRASYAVDVENMKTAKLNGDTWFNFMAFFADMQRALVVPEVLLPYKVQLEALLESTALRLISLGDNASSVLDFDLLVSVWSLARCTSDTLRESLQRALVELGFKRAVLMASGEASPAKALACTVVNKAKDPSNATMYDMWIKLEATTRRRASHELAQLQSADRSEGYRVWYFAAYDASAFIQIVRTFWPLADIPAQVVELALFDLKAPEVEKPYSVKVSYFFAVTLPNPFDNSVSRNERNFRIETKDLFKTAFNAVWSRAQGAWLVEEHQKDAVDLWLADRFKTPEAPKSKRSAGDLVSKRQAWRAR